MNVSAKTAKPALSPSSASPSAPSH
jgi:hypothetical protein